MNEWYENECIYGFKSKQDLRNWIVRQTHESQFKIKQTLVSLATIEWQRGEGRQGTELSNFFWVKKVHPSKCFDAGLMIMDTSKLRYGLLPLYQVKQKFGNFIRTPFSFGIDTRCIHFNISECTCITWWRHFLLLQKMFWFLEQKSAKSPTGIGNHSVATCSIGG